MSNELFLKDGFDSNKYIDATGDVIIAKGGDGTLLRAINKFAYLNKPFFGIAAGTVNFLMNKDSEICPEAIYQKLKMIKATVRYEKENEDGITEQFSEEFQAFNEVMIGSSGGMNSWIEFTIHDKEEVFGSFKGGGLIISTPQGSTGVSKSAFGPILELAEDMWAIVGDKTKRLIKHVITPRDLLINASDFGSIIVWIDGSSHIIHDVVDVALSKGDEVVVVFNNDEEFKEKRRI